MENNNARKMDEEADRGEMGSVTEIPAPLEHAGEQEIVGRNSLLKKQKSLVAAETTVKKARDDASDSPLDFSSLIPKTAPVTAAKGKNLKSGGRSLSFKPALVSSEESRSSSGEYFVVNHSTPTTKSRTEPTRKMYLTPHQREKLNEKKENFIFVDEESNSMSNSNLAVPKGAKLPSEYLTENSECGFSNGNSRNA